MTKTYASSELIVSKGNRIYHLDLHPDEIADDIILVGDPGRVAEISSRFDKIEVKRSNREFSTHTGTIGNKRLSVLSSGIGTDNIDIVVNELDALANINLEKRRDHPDHKALNLIRLGTSGALQADIPVDSFVISKYGLGIDGLAHFYNLPEGILESGAGDLFIDKTQWPDNRATPYLVRSSADIEQKFPAGIFRGITITAPGFYGPQGRQLRLSLREQNLNSRIASFSYQGYYASNYEMETSALYALGRALGHQVMTICAIIANRPAGAYSKDHKTAINNLIDLTLNQLTT